MTILNAIENNFYQFYRIFALAKKDAHILENGFEVIDSKDNSWPKMIFNLDQSRLPEKLIPQIATAIDDKHYPPYFIAPEKYISREHISCVKKNSILPVKILMGMNFTQKKENKIILPPKCEIRKLSGESILADFAELIKQEFIAPEMSFDKETLINLSTINEIQMSGLYYGNILAASMFILIKENIAGLYFIVTKKEYQNKGFATLLIKSALKNLFEIGVKEVVLHANHNSFSLYSKLGFTERNRFIIYRKV